ncbi:S8 family serine peptidase [Sporichthya polymorpha]|uniref:S8 family serine peptidase n=1 Tax=Sporichthya polymorpha TaxID=35751 RepID=UPI0003823D79|nr:S8 family serine peptidase [Sporichthya polymorpha]
MLGSERRTRRAALGVAALAVVGLLGAVALQASPATSEASRAAAPETKLRLSAPADTTVIPDAYLVSLAEGEPAAVAAEHAEFGVTVDRVFTRALRGYSARMTAALARRVAADPRVRTVTLDRRVSAASQLLPPGIARVGAPSSQTQAGDGAGDVDADIAILDTGIDVDHPDLHVVGGVDCVSDGALLGTSPSEPSTDPAGYDDPRGHGTHIAGIAAARDNGVGVVGVAPGARLWAVRVLDSAGNGSLGTLICGIEWVTANAGTIDVANMSLSGLDPDLGCRDGALHEAICGSVAAGVTYTVAAGNASADAEDYSPASYAEVVTVSALADYDGKPGGLGTNPQPLDCLGEDDEFAEFSNYGEDVDLIAPGVCILSTWHGGRYVELTGTSQAAAHVAGAAAIYRAAHPSATPAQVRAALLAAASSDWVSRTDPDGRPDRLLDVSKL